MGAPKKSPVASPVAADVRIKFFSAESSRGQSIADELKSAVSGLLELDCELMTIEQAKMNFACDLVLLDGLIDRDQVLEVLSAIERAARAASGPRPFVVMVVDASANAPADWIEGSVDEVLVRPFRSLEVLGKLRLAERTKSASEDLAQVTSLNQSLSNVVGQLGEDLSLATRLQKEKHPKRFAGIKGFKVECRYLAGMRSGGDHVDLAESPDKQQLSLVLTDASSYGLSSAVLAALMRVAVKLSTDEARSCAETVRKIQAELQATLNEKDRLSLFYGVISRKDYRLSYLNLGAAAALYAPPGKAFDELLTHGGSLSRTSAEIAAGGKRALGGEVQLDPEGRLALFSDGFVEAAGGAAALRELMNRYRDSDPKDSLNELVYLIKSKFVEPDDLPPQDCTGVIFDVESRLIRLAKN